MADYIEREVVIRELRDVYEREFPTADGAVDLFANRIVPRVIKNIPTAEVEPVRHGEWTISEDDWDCLTTITCSECHEEWCFETEKDVSLLNYRYCPNCGARMDLGGADNG